MKKLLGIYLLSIAGLANAASAVAVDDETHQWGISFNARTIQEASDVALMQCQANGNVRYCRVVYVNNQPGYGAIYMGAKLWGISAGKSSPQQAVDEAQQACEQVSPACQWGDGWKDGH